MLDAPKPSYLLRTACSNLQNFKLLDALIHILRGPMDETANTVVLVIHNLSLTYEKRKRLQTAAAARVSKKAYMKFKGKVTEGTVASMGLVEGSVMAMIDKPKARGLNPDLEAMMERCNVEAHWAGQGQTSPAGFRNPNVNWGVSKMVEHGKKGDRPCSFCAHPNAKTVCSTCSQTRYCDQMCQLQHWKRGGHKKECKKVEKDAWKYGVVGGGGGLVGGGGA
ncbi:hypothetical protein TL16_g01836 [Triparma laevis f. inornata]|uniref:MYND-type domain-containing protein n=2 Tax=Triparma laevis TaxID=1534972 RepID=A0A9W7CD81_9STRA|nr:hypothetical protein TL16_g01836 [Triparma laevis f. inornata]GMI04447.1 hypothetical protein TrLO_g15445 [Triparma laevis f. longispina]